MLSLYVDLAYFGWTPSQHVILCKMHKLTQDITSGLMVALYVLTKLLPTTAVVPAEEVVEALVAVAATTKTVAAVEADTAAEEADTVSFTRPSLFNSG